MIENMVLFAALVLIAAVAGKANATTAMGAMIFFWARLAYAVIYLIGVPWLRTLAWFVSVIGMAMIAWPLCSYAVFCPSPPLGGEVEELMGRASGSIAAGRRRTMTSARMAWSLGVPDGLR